MDRRRGLTFAASFLALVVAAVAIVFAASFVGLHISSALDGSIVVRATFFAAAGGPAIPADDRIYANATTTNGTSALDLVDAIGLYNVTYTQEWIEYAGLGERTNETRAFLASEVRAVAPEALSRVSRLPTATSSYFEEQLDDLDAVDTDEMVKILWAAMQEVHARLP